MRTRWGTTGSWNAWCSTPLRARLLLGAALAALLAVTVVRPPPTPGPFARDFEAYYAGGAVWDAGGGPWTRDVWAIERTVPGVEASRDELLPFVGPAAFLPLWGALARLPFETARLVWAAVLGLAFFALVAATLALAGVRARFPMAAGALLALVSGPMLSDLALGQVALVAAAAVACALLALERRSVWAAAATFVAAIQPNLALALVARCVDRRALVAFGAAAGAFTGATLAFGGGLGGIAAYARLLREHGAAERFVSIQHTLPVVLAAFGVPRVAALALAALLALALVALVARAAFAGRAQPLPVAVAGIALLPLALPFFHEHDFVLELIPALLLLAAPQPRVRALAAVGAVGALVDWFGLAQRPAANAQIALFALAVAGATAAYAATARDWRPREAALPLLAATLLLAVALPVAAHARSPVWPDQLGPAYRADPAAAIATVWADEQQRSGLDRDVAGWGLLRAIPLAGSLLLAAAALRYRPT